MIAALTGALSSCMGTFVVGIVWSLVSVYLLGQIDPKFEPDRTVQLVSLIAFLGGLAGAAGGVAAYWVLFRRCASVRTWLPLLAGVTSGGCLAPMLGLVLQINPSPLPEMPGLIGLQVLAGFVINGGVGFFIMKTAYRRGAVP